MTALSSLEIQFYPPAKYLASYVSGYWVMRSKRSNDLSSTLYRALPNTQSNLIFNLSTTPLFPVEGATDVLGPETAYLVFASDRHQVYRFDGTVDLFGVQFRHGYLRELLRCDLHEARGLNLSLSDLFGAQGAQLQQQLTTEPCVDRRIQTIEKMLVKKCLELNAPNKTLSLTLGMMSGNRAVQRISTLSHHAGVSERQLERVYKQHLGFTPKGFAEIIRFWRSSMLLKTGLKPADIVHLLGFTDQPHFNRTFQRYAGISPGAYLREQHVGFIQDDVARNI